MILADLTSCKFFPILSQNEKSLLFIPLSALEAHKNLFLVLFTRKVDEYNMNYNFDKKFDQFVAENPFLPLFLKMTILDLRCFQTLNINFRSSWCKNIHILSIPVVFQMCPESLGQFVHPLVMISPCWNISDHKKEHFLLWRQNNFLISNHKYI